MRVRWFVPLQFLLLSILWGVSFLAIQVGLGELPPLLFAALRYDVAGLVLLAFALGTTSHWRPRSGREWLAAGVAGVFLIAGHHALLYLGQQHVSGAVAAVIISLVPVLTAFFAAVSIQTNGFNAPQYGGVALGFAGVVAVVTPTAGAFALGSAIGVGLIFLAAAVFAFGSVALRLLSTDLPLRSMQAWGMLIGSGLLHGASVVRGEPVVIPVSASSFGALAYLSLGAGVAAYLLYFDLLDRIGPSELNLVSYLQPIIATVGSWLFLGELIDSSAVLGMITIFVGFAVVKHAAVIKVIERFGSDIGIGKA